MNQRQHHQQCIGGLTQQRSRKQARVRRLRKRRAKRLRELGHPSFMPAAASVLHEKCAVPAQRQHAVFLASSALAAHPKPMDWRSNLLEAEADIATLVRSLRRVAVLGIKTEAQADEPAFYVPAALAKDGIEI